MSDLKRQHVVLVTSLEAAVPLWIFELQQLPEGRRQEVIARWAAAAADQVASRGDALQFGTKKRGEAAEVFNHLARGLAALAYSPGGVTFADTHWCVDHAACVDAEQAAADQPLPPRPATPTPSRGRAVGPASGHHPAARHHPGR